jgi:hypothetical protein
MHFVRPAFAMCQRRFGRGPIRTIKERTEQGAGLSTDLKLFATTFTAGFLFVSILIG